MLKLYLKISLEKLVSENKCQNTKCPRRNVVVVLSIMGLVVSDAAGHSPSSPPQSFGTGEKRVSSWAVSSGPAGWRSGFLEGESSPHSSRTSQSGCEAGARWWRHLPVSPSWFPWRPAWAPRRGEGDAGEATPRSPPVPAASQSGAEAAGIIWLSSGGPGLWRRASSGAHPNPGSLPNPFPFPSCNLPHPQHQTDPSTKLILIFHTPNPNPGRLENRDHRLSAALPRTSP